MVTAGRVGLLRRDRDFRLFWAGHTASVLGAQVSAMALPLVAAVTLDAGAGGVAAVATAAYLPNLLLPLVAGQWLERRRRRRVMVAADVARALVLAVVPVAYVLDALSLPLLVAVAFAVGAASVVFDIGSFAYVPSLVGEDDLPAANRATQGSTTAAEVAGPGLGGGLVSLLGPAGAMIVDAVSYVVSALGVAAARRPEPPPPEPDPDSAGALFGLRHLAENPFLRALSVHAGAYNAAAQIITVNLVVYVVRDRGIDAGLFGLALSAAGLGAFLGTLAALRVADRLGYGRAFVAALLLSCGVPLLIPVLPGDATALAGGLAACQFAAGLGLGVANVLSRTLRQVVAPRGSLARTSAGYRLVIYGTIPAGSAAGGALGHALGSRAAVAVGAAGLVVSALPMLVRRIRTLRSPSDARNPTKAPPADQGQIHVDGDQITRTCP